MSDVVFDTLPQSFTWEQTNDLRLKRRLGYPNDPPVLQQKWVCRENGAQEWIDVPEVFE